MSAVAIPKRPVDARSISEVFLNLTDDFFASLDRAFYDLGELKASDIPNRMATKVPELMDEAMRRAASARQDFQLGSRIGEDH